MARVTVEDCVLKVPNRFDLVMLAARRAREIHSGAPLTVDEDNDKPPVISLREIADETVSLDDLGASLVRGYQKIVEPEETEEEDLDLMEGEKEWAKAIAEGLFSVSSSEEVDSVEIGAEANTDEEIVEDVLSVLSDNEVIVSDEPEIMNEDDDAEEAEEAADTDDAEEAEETADTEEAEKLS